MLAARSKLSRDLVDIGLEPGNVVMVHCRMSALGHVVGGAETVSDIDTSKGALPYENILGEKDYIEHIARSAITAGKGRSGSAGEGEAHLFDTPGLVEHAVGWIERNFAS
jgi:aminoglycoside 3-N-acetyltransferase